MEKEQSQPKPQIDFEEFVLDEVLNNNVEEKVVYLLGRFQKGEHAILKIQKLEFDVENLIKKEGKGLNLQKQIQTFNNDVFYKFDVLLDNELNNVNIEVVYPTPERLINKYRKQQINMVLETPEMYIKVTQKYIQGFEKSSLDWLYNILDRKEELDRTIVEDSDEKNGFVLNTDLKYHEGHPDTYHGCALVNRRDLLSLRDLNDSHLPLLKNIYKKGLESIEEKVGIKAKHLRVYVHYMPTYFHLHIHFKHVSLSSDGGVSIGKAIFLHDIIDNIEMQKDYYQKKSLFIGIGDNDKLLQLLADSKYI